MKKIYVSIASYKDVQLQKTIDSLFNNALGPENIVVGCFIQNNKTDENYKDTLITNQYNNKVKGTIKEAGEIFSLTLSRERSRQGLDKTFDYVLQVDAHSRFYKNGDFELISLIEKIPGSKKIISQYAKSFKIVEKKDIIDFSVQVAKDIGYQNPQSEIFFKENYALRAYSKATKYEEEYKKGGYLCGGFIFAESEYFLTLKTEDGISFGGEEIFGSLKAFTYGWNIYTMKKDLIFHLYNNDYVGKKFIGDDYKEHGDNVKKIETDKIIEILNSKELQKEFFGKEKEIEDLYVILDYNLKDFFNKGKEDYSLIK